MDEPNIPRVDVNIPDRVNKLKAIGNSVVPLVCYELIKNIREDYEKN